MTSIQAMAAHVAGARARDLDAVSRDALKRHVVDSVAALIAGAHTGEGRALARLLPHGDGVATAVARRAATARLTEIDDIHLPSCTTPGSVVVTTALTLAAAQPRPSAQGFADAVAVGYEAMTRLGQALDGPKVLYRGVWPTCFTAPFTAAAVASRIAGLDAARTAHALGIALAEATPGPGRPGPPLPARWLVLGEGAREGALAARAAAEGFTGDDSLIDGNWLKGAHGLEAKPAAMTDGLGKDSVLTRLSIKPFCSAKQAVAAVSALRAIMGRGVAAGSIRSVKVLVPEAYRVMIGHPASAGNRSSSILSVAYQLAIAAHDPGQLYDVARERIATSGPVIEFANKVTVAADDTLAAHYPARWPARIEVETASGTLSEEVVDAPGDPGRPLDLAAVRDKFHRCIDPLIGAGEVDAWIAAAEGSVADDGALFELGRRVAAHEAKLAASAS